MLTAWASLDKMVDSPYERFVTPFSPDEGLFTRFGLRLGFGLGSGFGVHYIFTTLSELDRGA